LVPGCGRGYDVLLLTSFGFDAYGLDVSPLAQEAAKKERDAPDAAEKYPVHNQAVGRGEVKFVLADFFKDEFLAETGGGNFDVIFDYTFLCALPPQLRPRWAKRMAELLGPSGRLICLEFPLSKAPSEPGPPHGLTAELYNALLSAPGQDIEYDDEGCALPKPAVAAENALVKVDRWKAERTHKAGEGVDHVSVWKRKAS
jgi:methyl halide transferase